MVLSFLEDGSAKRISGSGAGPVTLDNLVAKGLVIHATVPNSTAEAYQITSKGQAALRHAEMSRTLQDAVNGQQKPLD